MTVTHGFIGPRNAQIFSLNNTQILTGLPTRSDYRRLSAEECKYTWPDHPHINCYSWRVSSMYLKSQFYSLFQKKRTFNSTFFICPAGEGGLKIHMVDYGNGSSTHAQFFSLENLQPFWIYLKYLRNGCRFFNEKNWAGVELPFTSLTMWIFGPTPPGGSRKNRN